MRTPAAVVPLALLALGPAAAPAVVRGGSEARAGQAVAPPGMIFLRGDRARVGADPAEIQTLMREFEKGVIANETPAHEVKVEDFFLMPTEVTNEQYAEYLLADPTRQPPPLWGKDVIDAAQAEFVIHQSRAADEAKRAGTPFERQSFDRGAWWDQNWKSSRWRIPEGQEAFPVVDVDYGDALGYTRWAGVRLMTEAEFQFAVRGRTSNPYPWGSQWRKDAAATAEAQRDRAARVGSFPASATPAGIHDLIGNVWEWTSTPYEPYEGFKPFKVDVTRGGAKRAVEGSPIFDSNKRVAVGGSYSENRLAARATTRGAIPRDETTEALGFRCAAGARPGPDVAAGVNDVAPAAIAPAGLAFAPREGVAIQRWTSRPGTLVDVPGYAVITHHEDVAFVPVERIALSGPDALDDIALQQGGTLPLGLLHTSIAVADPPLAPGTYQVAFRPRGKSRSAPADAGAAPLDAAAGAQDGAAFVLLDASGAVAAAIPGASIELEFAKDGSQMRARPAGAASAEAARAGGDPEAPATGTALVLTGVVKGASSSRSLVFELALGFAPGALEGWRGLE